MLALRSQLAPAIAGKSGQYNHTALVRGTLKWYELHQAVFNVTIWQGAHVFDRRVLLQSQVNHEQIEKCGTLVLLVQSALNRNAPDARSWMDILVFAGLSC